MSYALSADAEVAIANESAAARTPNYTLGAIAVFGMLAIPWLPVWAGALAGRKWGGDHGSAWGAAGGAALSILVIRSTLKKTGGVIT